MESLDSEDLALNELFKSSDSLTDNCEMPDKRLNENSEMEEISIVYDSIEPNYSTLLSMFPNVDAKYIREICVNPPFNQVEGNILVMLINHLLSYEDKVDESLINEMIVDEREVGPSDDEVLVALIGEDDHMNESIQNDRILSEMLEIEEIEKMEQLKMNETMLNEQLFSEFLQHDEEDIEQKAKNIERIIPDIDPDYLREFIRENHQNPQLLQEFVESKLLNKDYRKRDEHYAEKKKKQQIQQYITCFNVKEFIRQFPEPFEYFEDAERQCAKQEKALNFLLDRHICQPRIDVENAYTSNNYNLSLADKQLQVITEHNPSIQLNIEVDDIPLLQEIAFIQNKTMIRDYLEKLKEKEQKEMEILRAQKLLLECQCCYYEIKPTDCVECDSLHVFCKNCVIRGTKYAISRGENFVHCFQDSCKNEFTLRILRQVLPQNIFDTFLRKQQEMEVLDAKIEGLETCPFCTYQAIVPPQVQVFTCENQECMKITCRRCKKLNHLPIKCEDVLDEHKSRIYIEEEMSKALIRYCHKCNKPFVKESGCNKMTCRCGAVMCYICKQAITDYSHFDLRDCKTHQNSIIFDQEQIELKRSEAISKIRRDFPDLQIPDVK